MKLEGAQNCRDLGGYPTKYGGNTALGQFLRCDSPSKLTDKDLERLYNYGVRLQIDFRSGDEAAKDPSKLKGYKDIEYIQTEMIGDVTNAEGIAALPEKLGDMYIDFLDNKKAVYAKTMRHVIRHMDDCVFFNCTAGKDRTGTFAMIFLKLAGCSDETVIIDYQSSFEYIKEEILKLLAAYRAKGIDVNESLVKSDPANMEVTLKHLKDKYGCIEHWLSLTGLEEWEIGRLRVKILGNF
jgi:protein-tyrosine phosphatase